MQRGQNVLFGALVYFLIAPTIVSGYSNDGAFGGPHRMINQYALEKFAEKVKQDPILSKYDFAPSIEKYGLPTTSVQYDQPFTVESDTVTRSGPWAKDDKIVSYGGFMYDGNKYVEEGKHRDTFTWWIKEGGFTADEPEFYMSLRHFYDPTNQATAYLTDLIGEPGESSVGQHISLMGDNPRVNARDWALYGNSPYSLNDVSKNFADAQGPGLKLSLPADREKYFGRAWRGIGETMHLMADMTVPAHVRNDGHPGTGDFWANIISWWGKKYSGQNDMKADPYESYVIAQDVSEFAYGAVSKEMEKKITDAKTPLELFDTVALYTNAHFFSEDTISGKDVHGNMITSYNGQNSYPSPKLDRLFFEVTNDNAPAHYYIEDELGRVDMASSRYIADYYLFTKAQLSIDQRCVKSQANRLIPLAIVANGRLLELVIPRIGVIIDGLNTKDKTLKCHMVHFDLQDGQFDPTVPVASNAVPTTRERALIKLSAGGETKVFWQMITNLNAGVFEISLGNIPSIILDEYLKNDPSNPPTAAIKVTAGIDMGGIAVWSDEFVPQALNISPDQAEMNVSSSQSFRAESVGHENTGVVWSIREKNGGTITQDGEYRSPETPGGYHIEVSLKDNPMVKAVALVKVIAIPIDVSPKKMTIDNPRASLSWKNLMEEIAPINPRSMMALPTKFGQQRHGFILEKTVAGETRWSKIIEEGDNPSIGSDKSPYSIWMEASVVGRYVGISAKDYRDSEIDRLKKSGHILLDQPKIGDETLWKANLASSIRLISRRGPFWVDVTVLLRSSNTPNSKIDRLREKMIDEGTRLTAKIMEEVDQWYYIPISDGPGAKGLFANVDMNRYILPQSELPTGLHYNKSNPVLTDGLYGGIAFEKNKENRNNYQCDAEYGLGFQTFDILAKDETARDPVKRADEYMKSQWRSKEEYLKGIAVGIPGSVWRSENVLNMQSTDDAIRIVGGKGGLNDELLYIRKANVVIELRVHTNCYRMEGARYVYYDDLGSSLIGQELVQKVLDKMAKDRFSPSGVGNFRALPVRSSE